jgi:hypothetical protein
VSRRTIPKALLSPDGIARIEAHHFGNRATKLARRLHVLLRLGIAATSETSYDAWLGPTHLSRQMMRREGQVDDSAAERDGDRPNSGVKSGALAIDVVDVDRRQ